MRSCPKCDGDTRGSTKFCPECGLDLSEVAGGVPESAKMTTRELGDILEDGIEDILKKMGYSTRTRVKRKGESGSVGEIDIMAEKGDRMMAVECKNYDKSAKIGVEDMRNFASKLKDLGIDKGLFVTTSSFSQGAAIMAKDNPESVEIELWDDTKIAEIQRSFITGRGSKDDVVRDCLDMRYQIDDYCCINLQNNEMVSMADRRLEFRPYYIVKFTLNEQYQTPNKIPRNIYVTGKCILDGLTGRMIYGSNGKKEKTMGDDEEKKIAGDLNELNPSKTVRITQTSPRTDIVEEPGKNHDDIRFEVHKFVRVENTQNITYTAPGRRGEKDKKEKFQYIPKLKGLRIDVFKLIRVPRLEITFSSKEYKYSRVVLPASDTVLVDEIAKCKHVIGSKPTYAVCNICGVAKCEKDITNEALNEYYCKKHIPKNPKDAKSKFGFFKR
ncbi:MAG: restriction endonuclease [Nitrosopumilus sp.]|nr:restriction endonuclease [Nitrosopumilus sp.]MDA7943955.1 restriction endonuclease [Nitrosopumilus sp.]MDA7999390.1 restriction endonuclease [Nitrosopumilus sp.]